MTHTFLFTIWEGAGLVPAELAVAGRLVERGHRVEVLGDPSTAAAARAAGAGFRTWPTAPHRASARPEDDPVKDWETSNPLEMMRRARELELVGPAPAQAADLGSVIAEVRPDVVVTDAFQLGAQVGSQAAGRPTASLVPNVYPFPAAGLPPYGTGWGPAGTPVGRVRDRAGWWLVNRLWDRSLDDFNRLRTDLGLTGVRSLWDHVATLDRQLILTSPSFDLPATLPGNAVYVGPELADPHWSGPWTPPPGDDPLILVGLCSGFMDQGDLTARIVDALNAGGHRAVVTTGPALDPARYPGTERIQVVRSAPHQQVLPLASAVVTHAGHGTTVKALSHGVPLLCIPLGRDQPDNAARVRRLGAGLQLKPSASPGRIGRALRDLIDDGRYRRAAEAMARRLEHEHDPGRVIGELEGLARTSDEDPLNRQAAAQR